MSGGGGGLSCHLLINTIIVSSMQSRQVGCQGFAVYN